MADPRRVAVIDIGKTNAKVALVDLETRAEVALRRTPNAVLTDGPYPHFDIDRLWEFILESLAGLAREASVDAISVTTHGATAALLDAAGGLALPVLDYEYEGQQETRAAYESVRPRFAETGTPPLPNGLNLGAQLFWQQRSFPEAFGRVAAILPYPQYWSWRLSGVPASEATSLGCHTDLWAPARRDFSSMVDRLGWRRLFPPVRAARDRLGPLRPELAARLGLPPGIPVLCGIHDSNASLLPHLMARPRPFSVVSTGTWVVSMSVGGQPVQLDPARDTLINVDALGEPVASARFMGGREYERLTAGLPEATPDDVVAVLREPTLLLPSVVAGCGPFPGRAAEWRPARPERPGQLRAAASFYLALMTATCLELIGADGPVVLEGPLAADALVPPMLSAAAGREVVAAGATLTGTSIGAALLAAAALRVPAAPGGAGMRTPGPDWAAYAAAWRRAL